MGRLMLLLVVMAVSSHLKNNTEKHTALSGDPRSPSDYQSERQDVRSLLKPVKEINHTEHTHTHTMLLPRRRADVRRPFIRLIKIRRHFTICILHQHQTVRLLQTRFTALSKTHKKTFKTHQRVFLTQTCRG